MDKFKTSISSKLTTLGQSFNTPDDTMMDDMSDFVLSPYDPSAAAERITPDVLVKQTPSRRPLETGSSDSDVISSIDAVYFVKDEFDDIDYELKKMVTTELCFEDIDSERLRLKSQLQVVSKKISALILEKSPSYSSQLDDMAEISSELGELIKAVRVIRAALSDARNQSTNALRILANEKRKQQLLRLKTTLHTIKTLHETEFRLRELIEEGKFPLAIEVCSRAKQAAEEYQHYSCVSELLSSLSACSSKMSSSLSAATAQLTLRWDADRYSFVHTAYTMLGETTSAADALIATFHASLDSAAKRVLEEKVRSGGNEAVGDLQFDSLCELLHSDQVVSTMRELGLVLCKVLTVYHHMLRFHIEDDERSEVSRGSHDGPSEWQQKLRASLFSVFRTALLKWNALLTCHDLSALKFDHILEVVEMTNRLRRFGRAYFSHPGTELSYSLERHTALFFSRYHRERLDELRMFLENECFALCPVPYQFTIFDLHEFSFLKESRGESASEEGDADGEVMPPETPNPFARHRHLKSLASHTSHTSASVDELDSPAQTPTTPKDVLTGAVLEDAAAEPSDYVLPNLCNTALNLLRFFGRYIRMSSLLPSLCQQSIPAVAELFYLFYHSIVSFFASDADGDALRGKREQMELVMRHMEERVFGEREELSHPSLSCAVQLNYPDQLFAAAERIVAMESIEFVGRQLDLMRPVIESLVPEQTDSQRVADTLSVMYADVVPSVSLASELIRETLASRALNTSVLIQKVAATKWDINELKDHHSSYVDFLVQDLDMFSVRLAQVGGAVAVGEALRRQLWTHAIHAAFRALVQGYCDSGRCSSEGRALMQLDFQHLLGKIERMSGMKPVPHSSFVDGYIKAYYLPENGLEQWISQHPEYSSKQMMSLLGVATHVSKKARTRIISALNN